MLKVAEEAGCHHVLLSLVIRGSDKCKVVVVMPKGMACSRQLKQTRVCRQLAVGVVLNK